MRYTTANKTCSQNGDLVAQFDAQMRHKLCSLKDAVPKTASNEHVSERTEVIVSMHLCVLLGIERTMRPCQGIHVRAHYDAANRRLCMVRIVHIRDCTLDDLQTELATALQRGRNVVYLPLDRIREALDGQTPLKRPSQCTLQHRACTCHAHQHSYARR
jgi:hypothetical protein